MKKIRILFVLLVSIMIITSCGVSNKTILRYQKLEETMVMKNLYLAENIDEKKKERILKKFFKAAFERYEVDGAIKTCREEYNLTSTRDLVQEDKISKCVNAVKNNSVLVNQIVSGEILAEPFINLDDRCGFFDGDYTGLLTCQIKSVERYIKEVLLKYHRNNYFLWQYAGLNV